MYRFNVTLVKQSRKPDPKTGRKKRTKRKISNNESITFDTKIMKGEKEDMKINMNEKTKDSSYEFKVKIHRDDEVNEIVNDNFHNSKEDLFKFNTRIIRSGEEEKVLEEEQEEYNPEEIIPEVYNPTSIIDEEYTEEETPIESDEEDSEDDEEDIEDSDEEKLDEEVIEESDEEEYLPDDADEIEDYEEDESIPDETDELKDAGIDESVFDTITVNGEVMNVVEINPEDIKDYEDENASYDEYDEEYEEDAYDDLIPNKFKNDDNPKKRNKKIRNEF